MEELNMKNKVTVSIAGQEFTLVGTEDDSYVRRVAAHVDDQIRQVADAGRMSVVDSAVLAAVNIADQYFKEQESCENLRRQLKEALEDAARQKMELSDAKREIFKLQSKR